VLPMSSVKTVTYVPGCSARSRDGAQEGGRLIVGQALPKPALRPFLGQDTSMLAAIFVASIEGLTGDDYSEAQQQAWAAAADDEEQFGQRLASELTLVATLQNSPVGFASLKGTDHIDLLYVHPGAVGQGVAAMLCDALEKLAGGRGARQLTVDASDNAAEFFARRGYEAKQRNTVSVGGEWLANTTMQKTLATGAVPGAPT
jgi:putative acetyltransferase